MPRTPVLSSAPVLLSLLVLTVGVAGCIGDDATEANDEGQGTLPWATFEDVRDGSGGPSVENGSIEVQWLGPAAFNDVEQDLQPLRIHVVDAEAEEPITTADIEWGSWMPLMGHGTASEEDPMHVDHGVHEGVINPSMEGEWVLEIQIKHDEESYGFEIPYHVGAHAALQAEEGREAEEDEEDAPEPFEATYEDTIESTTEYEASWPATVESTNFTIAVGIDFAPTLPAATLNVTLASPSGEALATAELSGEESDRITLEDPPEEGDYALDVKGSAVDATYTLTVTVD